MNAKVRDVMTPGPIGVDYYQSIGTAARTMRDWGVGAVLVVSDQALYGLVTDRDLVVRAVADRVSVGATKMPANAARTQPMIHAARAFPTLLDPLSAVRVGSSTDARMVTPIRVR